ncbi:MAG: preprotein translocase subunit YajC [Clostridia bacterium]|nr:preprotein translocase subunit YajC [Clostridia bacterium]
MFWNLLTESGAGNTSTAPQGGCGNSSSLIMLIVLIGVFVVFSIFNRRSQKKRQQETENMLNAIQPGNKVKTIGGICGVVVEVCPEDNTFVLLTGTDASGKSYIKFDKQAVYQTDAVAKSAPVEEKAEPAAATEETVEETVEETTEMPAEETNDQAE